MALLVSSSPLHDSNGSVVLDGRLTHTFERQNFAIGRDMGNLIGHFNAGKADTMRRLACVG